MTRSTSSAIVCYLKLLREHDRAYYDDLIFKFDNAYSKQEKATTMLTMLRNVRVDVKKAIRDHVRMRRRRIAKCMTDRCALCMTYERTVIYLKCGHRPVCAGCVLDKCPVCNA